MKAFEELKEDLLTRAKNAGACQRGYAMGLRSETKADLLMACLLYTSDAADE